MIAPPNPIKAQPEPMKNAQAALDALFIWRKILNRRYDRGERVVVSAEHFILVTLCRDVLRLGTL